MKKIKINDYDLTRNMLSTIRTMNESTENGDEVKVKEISDDGETESETTYDDPKTEVDSIELTLDEKKEEVNSVMPQLKEMWKEKGWTYL